MRAFAACAASDDREVHAGTDESADANAVAYAVARSAERNMAGA
jgi:hypothetical protein